MSAIALLFTATAQHMSCCKMSATQEFAMLSDEAAFRSEHMEPGNYVYSDNLGAMMPYIAADGKEAKAFGIWSEVKSTNFVFVMHEWWGLNDYMKKQAAQIYKDMGNVNVWALDLYDGKVADNRDDAAKLMNGADENRVRAIIQGAIRLAGSEASIATIGWCFGGGWSLQATMMAGEQAAGCVIYYGMPEKDVEKLKTLQADVIGIFASKDEWISEDVVKEFESNMKEAGKKFDYLTFDADHAFANPSNPQHDSKAAEEAYDYAIKFLKSRF